MRCLGFPMIIVRVLGYGKSEEMEGKGKLRVATRFDWLRNHIQLSLSFRLNYRFVPTSLLDFAAFFSPTWVYVTSCE
ncbi:hypothetical protein RJT34_01088 [Clitoria ternatea]|uniref:Uncharacterized protein n=1 Tax=Clitoria ternatea TaxID=43366 RepID=A0AAN9Q114_CLITE